MSQKLSRVLTCIAHRGLHSQAPENTLPAISLALDMGVDAIEIDVWQIGGALLVTHDRRLGNQLPGEGLITQQSPTALRSIRLADNVQIPTLQEVLSLVNGQAMLNIELKGPHCVDATVALLKTFVSDNSGTFDAYIISSFDHHQLFALKQQLPQVKRGILTANIPLNYAAVNNELQAYSFHPCIDCINPPLIHDAQRRGLKVWVYTVNATDDMHLMADMGVDGIFTDCPDILMALNPD